MKDQSSLKEMYPLVLWAENQLLRTVCSKIPSINPKIKKMAKNLHELMHEYDGVWLAAPQIWQLIRMIAVTQRDISWSKWKPSHEIVMINPRILAKSEQKELDLEGCLSLPWVEWRVSRSQSITVEYMNLDGETCLQKAVWFNARVILHEIDHLDWILFIDKLYW